MKISDLPEQYRQQAKEKYEKACNRNFGMPSNRKSGVEVAKELPLEVDQSKTFTSPVRISFHSIRQFACDSDAVWIKAALDGIVKAGVLPDDTKEWIPERPVCTEEIGTEEKTIITIEEVEK